jgi:hypothetical protein
MVTPLPDNNSVRHTIVGQNPPPRSTRFPWVPLAGLMYALFCPVSQRYFHPFSHLLPYRDFHGPVTRMLGVGNISLGATFLRLLLLLPFAVALFYRGQPTGALRWQAVAAGMYWPLLISTLIIIGDSGYAVLWTWTLLPIHIFVAILACISVNRSGPNLGRWAWLGVVSGFALWLLSDWL